jgi:hypothetical protein
MFSKYFLQWHQQNGVLDISKLLFPIGGPKTQQQLLEAPFSEPRIYINAHSNHINQEREIFKFK